MCRKVIYRLFAQTGHGESAGLLFILGDGLACILACLTFRVTSSGSNTLWSCPI